MGESRDRSGVTSAVKPSETAHDDGGRIEAGSSLWTHVDRAFPDQPSSGAETGSVGTGRLAWDRVYTRRALFRFPVELGSDSPLESAVLRTEVAWSYDCESDSAVELHRVDPFDEDTTWNDQPDSQGLLDTRNLRGGHAACPLHGGVEFDVTEAYQQALDNGEHHLHLRLGSADESGNTAWRRFDVEDTPPVLVVDHGPAPARDLTSIAPSQTAAPLDDVTLPGDEPSSPAQPPTVPVGTTDLLIPGPLPDDPTGSGGERIRAPWAERVDRTTGDHRRGG
ncbi:DNRLRE domain-containing protein, partial [Nocardiopsis prasina]|uniref:DNRLRE domain-containing protein n=1 Tax=Nocardiopsis prasina TaxID=2015 RepID=UPI001EF9C9FE